MRLICLAAVLTFWAGPTCWGQGGQTGARFGQRHQGVFPFFPPVDHALTVDPQRVPNDLFLSPGVGPSTVPFGRDPVSGFLYIPNCPGNPLDIINASAWPFPGLPFGSSVTTETANGQLGGSELNGLTFIGVPGASSDLAAPLFDGNGNQLGGATGQFVFPFLQNINFTMDGQTTNCPLVPIQIAGNLGQLPTADPISTASGEFIVNPTVDISLGGPLPLFLRRSFSTFQFENSNVGMLGVSWMT